VAEVKTLLAAVLLGGAFGSAAATVEEIDDDVMVVTIEVEVSGSADAVVAHLTFDNDQPLTLPLLDRGDGLFGLRTELEPKNYFVVFEVIGGDNESSDPVSLTELGADLGRELGGTTTTLEDDDLSNESQRMLWLAVALAAGSLSLLAFWVLGGRDKERAADTGDERGDGEAPKREDEEE
jgi:hypothetical protein